MCWSICVCMRVCVYAYGCVGRMHVCMYGCISMCGSICVYVYVCMYLGVWSYACMYVWMYIGVRAYACMYVCMDVYRCVGPSVCVSVFVYVNRCAGV